MEIVLFVILAAAYLLPFIIAVLRKHRNALGIFILNLVFGWTLLGWIIALIWAVHRGPEAHAV